MKRWVFLVALVAGLGRIASSQMQPRPSPVLLSMELAAREAGVPAGIVLRKGVDLCHEMNHSAEFLPSDPMQRIRTLADQYGYHVDESGPVLKVMPKDGMPGELDIALHHHWPRFPKIDGIPREMGMTLSGWMFTVVNPGQGFAISSASNGMEERVHLPASEEVSSEEIANRIVSLGSKGIWIAWQNQHQPSSETVPVRLSIFSYRDDLRNMQYFRCN